MKILFVFDNSRGVRNLFNAIEKIPEEKAEFVCIKLSDYPNFPQDVFDGLIYNTFPDPEHPTKFRKDLIAVTDKKFVLFAGKSFLFNSHDDPGHEAFARFPEIFPRLRNSQNITGLANDLMEFFEQNDMQAPPEEQTKHPEEIKLPNQRNKRRGRKERTAQPEVEEPNDSE